MKISEKIKNELIEKYINGKSITTLSKEYPEIGYYMINQTLIRNNIPIRGGRKRKELSSVQVELLINNMNKGMRYEDIVELLGVREEIVRRYIYEKNLNKPKYRPVNKRINSNYFSNIDCPAKAYWLGLLFTDGSVDKKHRIRLQLQKADRHILEQFKNDLCLDSKIYEDIRPNSICYSLEFKDDQIYKDLCKFDIIPNKTYAVHHLPLDKIPQKYWKDFARGLYDGDGGIVIEHNNIHHVTINFTSYYQTMVEDFQKLIDGLINKEKHNKVFFTSCWHTTWRGRRQVLKILDMLYRDSTVHLDRKYQKYLQIKNSN